MGIPGQRAQGAVSRRTIWDLRNLERKLHAYDKASGRLFAAIPLLANAATLDGQPTRGFTPEVATL